MPALLEDNFNKPLKLIKVSSPLTVNKERYPNYLPTEAFSL